MTQLEESEFGTNGRNQNPIRFSTLSVEPDAFSSAQEGGDEDAGVQVEGGVPPAVREIQNLTEHQGVDPLLRNSLNRPEKFWFGPAHLSGSDGALQRRLLLRQVGVGLRQPGQGGAVGVEMRLLVRWVEEPALWAGKGKRWF